MSNQEQQFLQAITTNPEDDDPRLVYADWLSERGDLRGDYIRYAVDAATRPMWDPIRAESEAQADRILREHRRDWCRELRKITQAIYFHRGFVERISLKAARFEKAAEFFEHLPLRDLQLDGKRNEVGRLHDQSFLSRLRSLRFRGQKIGAKRFERFFESPYCQQLELLDLHSTEATTQIVCQALAALTRLRSLVLTSNDLPVTPEIPAYGEKLRDVRLPDNWFGWRVETSMIKPHDFPNLETIGNWSFRALVFEAAPGNLQQISDISYLRAVELMEARGQRCPPCRAAIGCSPADYKDFSQWLKRTQSKLSLFTIREHGDRGQEAVLPFLADLHTLVVPYGDGTKWLEQLMQSKHMPQALRVLDIGSEGYEGRTLARYLRSEAASHLVRLRIHIHYSRDDGDDVIDALLDSKHLSRLTHLSASVYGPARRKLSARFGRHVCQFTSARGIYPPNLPTSFDSVLI